MKRLLKETRNITAADSIEDLIDTSNSEQNNSNENTSTNNTSTNNTSTEQSGNTSNTNNINNQNNNTAEVIELLEIINNSAIDMKENIKENLTRKVYLDDVPKRIYSGRCVIDWNKMAKIKMKIRFIYNNIDDEVEISKYKNSYVYLNYKDKIDFKIHTSTFISGKLAGLLDIKTSDFKIKIGQVIKNNKRDVKILDRKKVVNKQGINEKLYFYHCNKCGYEAWALETSLLNKDKKHECSGCVNKKVVIGKNDIPTTAPWMVKFFQGGEEEAKQYTKSCSFSIKPICPICGRIRNEEMTINNLYRTHSIGCICRDGVSYPEKFMYSVLEQVLKDNFIHQLTKTTFKWIGNYRYDFYFMLNGKYYIIETDGGFHDEDNTMSGQTTEKCNERDDLKDKLAEKHNIKVIRINCKKSTLNYIKKEILKSELKNLFDLSNIDWKKCESFALSNRVKEACELKKKDPNLTTTQISKIMKLSVNTIIKYLKQGAEVNWCEYNPKEEVQKAAKINSSKKIEIFKDGKSLGKFKSIKDLVNQSLDKFKVKFCNSSISYACNKQKKYKEYEFKFI